MSRTNATAGPSNLYAAAVTIRRSTDRDVVALTRLAALDSRVPLTGDCLIAEVDGALAAARSLQTGDVAADPFRPTKDLVALLDQRARHLLSGSAQPARRRGVAEALQRLRVGVR